MIYWGIIYSAWVPRTSKDQAEIQLLDRVTDYFDIVIDLTDFSAANELPVAWMKRCLQICPPSILSCVNVRDKDLH